MHGMIQAIGISYCVLPQRGLPVQYVHTKHLTSDVLKTLQKLILTNFNGMLQDGNIFSQSLLYFLHLGCDDITRVEEYVQFPREQWYLEIPSPHFLQDILLAMQDGMGLDQPTLSANHDNDKAQKVADGNKRTQHNVSSHSKKFDDPKNAAVINMRSMHVHLYVYFGVSVA